MNVLFLSAANYENPKDNNGDCIIIDNGNELVVYDCGCNEHAERVLHYMHEHNYTNLKVVLSHNDSDHYKGIQLLVENNVVKAVYALLLMDYKFDILNLINDHRRKPNSVLDSICSTFDNITSLIDKTVIKDIFKETHVADGIDIIGPDKDYALNSVAKLIDSRESDIIDNETIVNAVSTQLSIRYNNSKKLLLTGDSNFESIKNSIKNHDAIQLPHHGKLIHAEEIFKAKYNSTIYYVSDNTGDSNGGSCELQKTHPRGYVIHYTNKEDQLCSESSFSVTSVRGAYSFKVLK